MDGPRDYILTGVSQRKANIILYHLNMESEKITQMDLLTLRHRRKLWLPKKVVGRDRFGVWD